MTAITTKHTVMGKIIGKRESSDGRRAISEWGSLKNDFVTMTWPLRRQSYNPVWKRKVQTLK